MTRPEGKTDVLHVGWGHPPATGGGPIFYLHHLCRRQQAGGMNPACFVAGMTPPAPEKDPRLEPLLFEGVPYDIVNDRPAHYYDWSHPAREIRNGKIEALFVEVLRRREPEIVHFHNLVGLSISLLRAAKNVGAATLFSVHNYWMLCPRDDLFPANEEPCPGPRDGARCAACVGQPHLVLDYMDRIARARETLARDADRILAVSERVKEILVRNGIPDEKIQVNRIGSAAAENNWNRVGKARTEACSVSEPVRFAYFGAMAPRKGAHVILEAATHLEDHAGRFLIELHGWNQPDPYRARLERLLEGKPFLKDCVRLMGKYTQEDLPALLSEVHAAIIPPIWEDNGPQTVMEALGAGVPVIGARIGGIPDFVRHGGNGHLFRAGDALELASVMRGFMDDPKSLEALIQGITPPVGMDPHVSDLEVIYMELRNTLAEEDMLRKKGEVLTHSAIDNRKSGRLEDAEAGFLKAIRCHSRPAEIRYQYALLLEDMGRSDESVGQLREALSLNPDHAQAHNDLGVHEYRRGREDEALQHLARACTLDPEDSTPLENMAAIHLEAGRDAKALEIYQLLLSRRPDDPDLLHQLGLICNRMGRSGDAAFFWSRVLEIAPDHREARSRLEALPPKGSPAHEHPMEG